MTAPAAMTAVSAALYGFSFFLIADHTADHQTHNNCQCNSNYPCSHKIPPFYAFAICFVPAFNVPLSLCGRNSRYKNPATTKSATAVPTPNTPVVTHVPI